MYALITKTSEKWRKKSGDANKLNTDFLFEASNEYGFPVVSSSERFSAEDLIPFNVAKGEFRGKHETRAVHFFIDDYRFEQICSHPLSYVRLLADYGNMVSPTFSVWSVQPYGTKSFQYVSVKILQQAQYEPVAEFDERLWDCMADYVTVYASNAVMVASWDGTRILKKFSMYKKMSPTYAIILTIGIINE